MKILLQMFLYFDNKNKSVILQGIFMNSSNKLLYESIFFETLYIFKLCLYIKCIEYI